MIQKREIWNENCELSEMFTDKEITTTVRRRSFLSKVRRNADFNN